jgi:hypothetical protein
MVLSVVASVAMRGVARAFQIFQQYCLGHRGPSPSYSSARLWLLRVGIHKLKRVLPKSGDWIFIIDHCVQVGPAKLFVVLGIRLSRLGDDFRLGLEQVEPIHVELMGECTGASVFRAIERAALRTGEPCSIVSDAGSDLRSGVNQYQLEHPGTAWFYDIAHKVAAVLKKMAAKDEGWQAFTAAAARFKLTVQQTTLAPLAPPAQRGKARFMNIDVLTQWGCEVLLKTLQMPADVADQLGIDPAEVVQALAWAKAHVATVRRWLELMKVAEMVKSLVRTRGYSSETARTLQQALSPSLLQNISEPAKQLAATLTNFVREQSLPVPTGASALGSSESLECLYGKYKFLENTHVTGGFTHLIAGIAALTSTTTPDVVKQALESVSAREASSWLPTEYGGSTQAIRRRLRALKAPPHTEEKQGNQGMAA